MLVKPTTDVVAKIKVIGVGGGGGNTVNTMISQYNIEGVEFISVNTDAQVLKNSLAPIQLQIGTELTRGLGSGGDPEMGANSAEESVDAIHEHLAGADMVFLTCGMGGGTGTGATPVISSIAKNLGALTVGVVTKPFMFEGKRRMDVALEGIEEFSHIWVVWWLDQFEGPPSSLQVRPERRAELPLVGLFATRSPHRPNPIAITAVHLLERNGTELRVEGLDACQGTPVLDIKPYLQRGDLIPEASAPSWLQRLWHSHDEAKGT